MRVFWPSKISNARRLHATEQDAMGIISKRGRWSCVKNAMHSACKNLTDIDFRGKKEKGVPQNNMEETGNGGDEECWYWLGKSHKTCPSQSDLVGPR